MINCAKIFSVAAITAALVTSICYAGNIKSVERLNGCPNGCPIQIMGQSGGMICLLNSTFQVMGFTSDYVIIRFVNGDYWDYQKYNDKCVVIQTWSELRK